MERKIDEFSKDEIVRILNESKSFKEAITRFGYSSNGSGGYSTVKSHLKNIGIVIPKYHYYGTGTTINRVTMAEILIENSTYQNRGVLKKRLVKEGILEYRCKCGSTGMWEGKPLSLQLEHKNGKNNDNRIENLEFLCPNCHSQSATFGGRNNKCSLRKTKIFH